MTFLLNSNQLIRLNQGRKDGRGHVQILQRDAGTVKNSYVFQALPAFAGPRQDCTDRGEGGGGGGMLKLADAGGLFR